MRGAPWSFSRFSTRDSYIALSCAMKHEPSFKTLQANPTCFKVMASQYLLYFRQQTQGPSHIPIAEGRLLLRCLGKVGLLLQQNPGNLLSSRDDMASMELSSSSCAETGVPLDLRRVYQGISVVALSKTSHLSCRMGNGGLHQIQHRRFGGYLELIWVTPNNFTFLW